MMYRVIKTFFDLRDENREYRPGDIFPREGYLVDSARIEMLATEKNRLGCALIRDEETESETDTKKKTRKKQKGNSNAE